MTISQNPTCGQRLVRHRGDLLDVRLTLNGQPRGQAFVRCNIHWAAVRRAEVVAHAEDYRPMLARDWHDVPMEALGDGQYRAVLPLLETGSFEAKAFFLPDEGKPRWPSGENLRIKVLPAYTVCANAVYTTFPRQFGAAIDADPRTDAMRQAEELLSEKGYAVIPRSGTFRDVIQRLDVIMGTMGFRILQLLPVHPVPTTFARMGRFGSPFASRDFFSVDPAMAEFDRSSTPMEQFEELVDAVHSRDGYLFIDLPCNHTGWASWLQLHHPEWFERDETGSFINPGAWGVVWEDLCALDYDKRALWMYMADVFLHWCRRGVDGFRCDAGYMIPVPVWRYITSKVRQQFPHAVFLLEGLGGPHATAEALMTDGGLDWAYSELFQCHSAESIRACLRVTNTFSAERGLMVHFAETHDNDRLAAASRRHARFRCALAAMLSHDGAFGITNGVEWYATEKLMVHDATPLNWGADDNQVQYLTNLIDILANHPGFAAGVGPRPIETGAVNTVGALRKPDHGPAVLVLANVSVDEPRDVSWTVPGMDSLPDRLRDLLTGTDISISSADDTQRCRLEPETVVCLQLHHVQVGEWSRDDPPERVLYQRFRALALTLYVFRHGFGHVDPDVVDDMAELIAAGPRSFLESLYRDAGYCPAIHWHAEVDVRRVVMVPPRHILVAHAAEAFRVALYDGERCVSTAASVPDGDGAHLAFLFPPEVADAPCRTELHLRRFGDAPRHDRVGILLLNDPADPVVNLCATGEDWREKPVYALCAGPLGEMAQVQGCWGDIRSKYDAFLAANASAEVPVDRRVLLSRLRAWVVYRDYSQDINDECQTAFLTDVANRVRWTFDAPVGMGAHVSLNVTLDMGDAHNHIRVLFERPSQDGCNGALADRDPVTLIIRPDIEDRSMHETTRAMDGPESLFPDSTAVEDSGFSFNPFDRGLFTCDISDGAFVYEPEWKYMVPHPVEASRGLSDTGDLFSPGYFSLTLLGGESAALHAYLGERGEPCWADASEIEPVVSLDQTARRALRQFVVRRNQSRTVIAGYPWFLDWGRDTLICLRGMIEGELLEDAAEILRQFASFEDRGTLPNMIRGNDDRNRDTSDAGLWLFTAVEDFLSKSGSQDILEVDCAGRSLRQVLVDLAHHLLEGTPNGIYVDQASAMVFSPSHFTWMDTNHSAGTPREGFPIEIQALWFAALRLLDSIAPAEGPWRDLQTSVQEAVQRLFVLEDNAGLSDCLHGGPGTPADDATRDDACRPNQLLAITRGLIRDESTRRGILRACAQLVVPGGIRSLADRAVSVPLLIERDGQQLNDPCHPYWGRYEGDEDTRRKPAYHNGTAWSWLFPSYPEAMVMTCGDASRAAARALLLSMIPVMEEGCLGHVPEIVDGDAPHTQRGCGAQAWGVSELLRVYRYLRSTGADRGRRDS